MSHPVEWSAFYKTLNRLGPRLLQGVDPALEGLILDEARDSDAFWSGSLEALFEGWPENPERAILYALRVWASNVRRYLQDFLGPESLFPFESIGITSGDRRQFIASLKSIRPRALDRQHLRLFMDSVLIGTAETVDSSILLVQGLIKPYRKTTEGALIRAVAIPWQAIVHHLKQDWTLAYQIPPEKWEEIVAAAFDRAGYDEVVLTPRSGDHGRDVIALKKGIGSIRIIDSVKAYKPGHPVRYDDVRALAGVLLGDPKASKGIVTTTSTFAPGIAKDPYLAPLMPYRLELMDGPALRQWLEDLALS